MRTFLLGFLWYLAFVFSLLAGVAYLLRRTHRDL